MNQKRRDELEARRASVQDDVEILTGEHVAQASESKSAAAVGRVELVRLDDLKRADLDSARVTFVRLDPAHPERTVAH